MRLRVLCVTPRVPWPLDTGGTIRTHYLIRALSRAHDVKLVTFASGAADAAGLAEMGRLGIRCELVPGATRFDRAVQVARGAVGPLPINIRKYQSEALQTRVRELVRDGVDVVHCDHLHMSPYGLRSGVPFVMDEHNIETLIFERLARDESEPAWKRLVYLQQAFWLGRLERRLGASASLVLFCSAIDQGVLTGMLPGATLSAKVVPNGVDVEYFGEAGPALPSGLVFTGAMDWTPNVKAAVSFVEEAWPLVRRQLPGTKLTVVGRNPSASLRETLCAADGVEVTGTVDDVRPYLRGALAMIVPIRVGSGTRLKILTAFAARTPVISTAVGIEGIEAVPGTHYLHAETAEEFADCALCLQRDPGLRERMVEAAFNFTHERYSWETIGADLARDYARRFGGG